MFSIFHWIIFANVMQQLLKRGRTSAASSTHAAKNIMKCPRNSFSVYFFWLNNDRMTLSHTASSTLLYLGKVQHTV